MLELYLKSGGNILYLGSAAPPIIDTEDDWDKGIRFFDEYAGFSSNNFESTKTIGTSIPSDLIFPGAILDSRYSNPAFPDSLNIDRYKNALTSYIGKIGSITILDIDEATPIYNFNTDNPNYQGCVASKYTTTIDANTTATTYILGFPLYYIEIEQAKQFIEQVLTELNIQPIM